MDYKDFIELLKSKISIAGVIKDYTSLKQKYGGKYVSKCPFHKDDTPSFSVDDVNGFFYCFGCLEKGDVISFVQKIHNLSFSEAVEMLANKNGIDVPSFNQSSALTSNARNQTYQVLQKFNDLAKQRLNHKTNTEALKYLYNRGFTDQTIKDFNFGICDKVFDDIFTKSTGFTTEDIQSAGLYSIQYGNLYNRFGGRIVVPIMSKNDKIVGFGGRIFTEEQQKVRLAKYINSPETEVFKKNEILFNYNNLKNQKSDTIIVVEGYFDVIKLWQVGIKNAVAPMGTNITEWQINLLFKSGKKILFCFDNDQAGKNASLRALNICFTYINPESYCGFVSLPNSIKDPDEMIESYGINAFLLLLKDNISIERFFLENLLLKYDITKPDQKTILEKVINTSCISVIKHKDLAKNYQNFFYLEIKNRERQNKKANLKSGTGLTNALSTINKSLGNITTKQQILMQIKKIEHRILQIIVSNIDNLSENDLDDIFEIMRIDFYDNDYKKDMLKIVEIFEQQIQMDQKQEKIKTSLYYFYSNEFKLGSVNELKQKLDIIFAHHKTKLADFEIIAGVSELN
jgi:DNA primase